jgi:hypothetical protein
MRLTTLAITAAGLAVYLAPAVVAAARRRPRWPAILMLDLLVGWTVVGWVVALVWALRSGKPDKIPDWQAGPPP